MDSPHRLTRWLGVGYADWLVGSAARAAVAPASLESVTWLLRRSVKRKSTVKGQYTPKEGKLEVARGFITNAC